MYIRVTGRLNTVMAANCSRRSPCWTGFGCCSLHPTVCVYVCVRSRRYIWKKHFIVSIFNTPKMVELYIFLIDRGLQCVSANICHILNVNFLIQYFVFYLPANQVEAGWKPVVFFYCVFIALLLHL